MPESINAEYLYKMMKRFVSFGHRVTGSAEERTAAEFIARQFRAAGLSKVALEPFDIRRYEVQKLSLRAWVGESHYEIPAHPVWYTRRARIRGRAVPLGLGAPRDFAGTDIKGKVAVVDSRVLLNYYPTHSLLGTYHQAVKGGAVGYIACIDAPYDLAPRYNHLHEDEPPGSIPGLILARSDGIFLMDLMRRYAGVLDLEITADARESVCQTADVVGYLPGSDDVVIVGSHYDSVYDGAIDNAAANAGLIALARHAAGLKRRKPTVVFCAHPGHEVNIGSREFVKRHRELIQRAYLYLSIDGFGSSGYAWNGGGAVATSADEKRGISVSNNPLLLKLAMDAVRKHGLLPAAYVPASDIIFNKDLEGRFHEMGVPTLMIIGKPIWYHSTADTPDKITPDQLYRSFLAHAEILKKAIALSPRQVKANDRMEHAGIVAKIAGRKVREAGFEGGRGISFGCLPEPAAKGDPVLFFINDFSNPAEVVVDIRWEFGDGTAGRGPVLAHVYERAGRHTVSVSLLDAGGNTTTATRGLWVV